MTFDQNLLQRCWLHAHEEDSPGKEVFRPDTHPLPPSRGRFGYEFRSDGCVLKLGPSPTDRRTTEQGTWAIDTEGRITIHIPGHGDETLEVDALEPDRLVVKKQ